MGRFSAYYIYGAFCKILKNTENACKILKNRNIYTERQEDSLEALSVVYHERRTGAAYVLHVRFPAARRTPPTGACACIV